MNKTEYWKIEDHFSGKSGVNFDRNYESRKVGSDLESGHNVATKTSSINSLNGCHHIETSRLICRANQLTGFYVMASLAFNKLISNKKKDF